MKTLNIIGKILRYLILLLFYPIFLIGVIVIFEMSITFLILNLLVRDIEEARWTIEFFKEYSFAFLSYPVCIYEDIFDKT